MERSEEPGSLDDIYRAVVNSDHLLIGRWLPDTTITYVSPSVTKILGVPPAAFIGSRFLDVITETHRDNVAHQLAGMTPDNAYLTIDNPMTLPDGSIRSFQWSMQMFFGPDGERIGGQSIGTETTLLQRAIESAERAENRLQTLLAASHEVVALHDADGARQWVSGSALTVFGYSPDRLEDSRRNELVHPDDLHTVAKAFVDTVDGGPRCHHVAQMRVRSATGEWRWAEAAFTNLLHQPGIEAVAVFTRDITERVQLVEMRHDHELRLVINQMGEYVLRVDNLGIVRYASTPFLELYDDATPVGLEFLSLVVEDDRRAAQELIEASTTRRIVARFRLLVGDAQQWSEWFGRRIDGELVLVARSAEAAEPMSIVAAASPSESIGDEISNLVRRYRQLRPSQQARFIAELRAARPNPGDLNDSS